MAFDPKDTDTLGKYTQAAQKIIYDPKRMSEFLKMMGTAEGAITAVQTVVGGIDKIKPVPPQIAPLLGVNTYMLMVDVAQEATGEEADPGILKQVVGQIMGGAIQTGAPQGQAPAQPGMLAQMQDAPGPDETQMHEGAEPAATEMAEGAEEDSNVMSRMRRGVPA